VYDIKYELETTQGRGAARRGDKGGAMAVGGER